MMFKLIEYGNSAWSSLGFKLKSGTEDSDYCTFSIHLFSKYWYWQIPNIIKPKIEWVDLSKQEWATPGPDGRRGYYKKISKMYGFTIADEYVHVYYGIQPGNWTRDDPKNSDHTKLFEIPWRQTRRVRYDFMNRNHTVFTTVEDNRNGGIDFDAIEDARKVVPKIKIKFKDFDGEDNVATCHITEMEWRYGTGCFKWIGLFRKPIIRRRLEIEFEKETGRQKGSWKGGTMGTSTDIEHGEHPMTAFQKYGRADAYEKYYGLVNRGFTDMSIVYE
jgi:hypothetical protein